MRKTAPKQPKQADRELTEGLQRSNSLIPQLYPILVAADGEVIDGFHRSSAGFTEIKKLDWAVSEKEKIVAKAAANYRRSTQRDETEGLIQSMIKILEGEGVTQKNMAVELKKQFPFTDRTIREYLPDEYKQTEMRRKPSKSAEGLPQKTTIEQNNSLPTNDLGESVSRQIKGELQRPKNEPKTNSSDVSLTQAKWLGPFKFKREFKGVPVNVFVSVRSPIEQTQADLEVEVRQLNS